MIRVVVIDDSTFVRQALARMLGKAGDVEVVGMAADGKEGVAAFMERRKPKFRGR